MTELKTAQPLHSIADCNLCMGYVLYKADSACGCAVCGKDFHLVHYGHMTCPECGAELTCDDPWADELGREEKHEKQIRNTDDGRETWYVPGRKRDRLL